MPDTYFSITLKHYETKDTIPMLINNLNWVLKQLLGVFL